MKAHCLPFHQVPHTSRLFSDFLYDFPKVQKFYASAPQSIQDFANASKAGYDPQRREQVAAVLERQNRVWGASGKVLENISRFRAGASVIVTGQQVGLFGGPVFALYKALTAIKAAEKASAAGVNTVPVFWLATEDHDLAEVDHVLLPGDFSLQTVRSHPEATPDAPVGTVKFDRGVVDAIDQAAQLLGESEALALLRETYRPEATFGSSFAQMFAKVFAEFGLILLDSSDKDFHRIAEPVMRDSIERVAKIDDALLARGKELERAGYHQQVKVTESSTLLFAIQNGRRLVIQRKANGTSGETKFQIGSEKIVQRELLRRISEQPENFSANALLRPVMQDYLLPTLAYVGGPAEVAYFAQSAVVYQELLGRITPVMPRFSATIVEPKPSAIMRRYGLSFTDLFHGPEILREELAKRALPADVQAAFEDARTAVEQSVELVKQTLTRLDSTLVEAATRAASKMEYQISRLRARAARAELKRVEVLNRHAALLSNSLYPEKTLQEREVGGVYFLAKYGPDFLRRIHDAIHLDCVDHQVMEI